MFKRRERRTLIQRLGHAVWPRGGWARALQYMRHRLRRLPDSPEKIARGIFAGVFISFTPLYGLHFIFSAALAWLLRGNIVAALIGNFFGNPLTYVPIGMVSLKTGHFILGTRFDPDAHLSLARKFSAAGEDLLRNARALFTGADTNWLGLLRFWNEVFLPYLVGGILPGIIAGLVCYYLSVPVIRAYQNIRRSRLQAKMKELRARALPRKDTGL